MTKFDLIVVGAGPAGSSAAMTAARSGLRVALVDKRAFPRDKLCGGGFTGRSLKYFQEIFGASAPAVPTAVRTDIHFCAYGQDMGHYDDIPPIQLVMRLDLDQHMVALALQAGAVDFTGAGTPEIDTKAMTVTLGDRVLHGTVILGADGVNSSVARALFGQPFDRSSIGFALEVERPETDRDLRIDFGAADWGYGWQFPKDGGVSIGVGGVLQKNADMKAALRRYLDTLGLPDDMQIKGQFLPFGDYRRAPGQGRVILAGDAAGLVDPITGEGIAYAMKSGQLAAQAVQKVLHDGRPERVLHEYKRALRPIHRALTQAHMIRPLLFSPALRNSFVAGFRRSSRLRDDYMRLLAGETEYGAITRRVLLRMPQRLIRNIRPTRHVAP